MNIDFTNEPLFSSYVLLLLLSGVLLVGLAALRSGGTGMRVFNALVGVAFLGYGVYLGFIFDGGTYIIFFKVLFVPALLIINGIKSYSARRNADAARAYAQSQYAQQAQNPQSNLPYYPQQAQYAQPQPQMPPAAPVAADPRV